MQAGAQSKYPRVLPLGDGGWTIEFGETIDPTINDRVLALTDALEKLSVPGMSELIPTYRSVAVYCDPLLGEAWPLRDRLLDLACTAGTSAPRKPRHVEIPVLYGGECGPDLADVAGMAGLSSEDVVALHTSVVYRVYMLGFSPGFPYLGTVPEKIAAPRLTEPRATVPSGSVGIAGFQTGIYPQESPGGWRLIGRTSARLYDPARSNPFLLQAGDQVRFVSLSREEYEQLGGAGSGASQG